MAHFETTKRMALAAARLRLPQPSLGKALLTFHRFLDSPYAEDVDIEVCFEFLDVLLTLQLVSITSLYLASKVRGTALQ